jgi:predicted nucleic acid-binding protein
MIVIDTSAFLAASDSRDAAHEVMVSAFDRLRRGEFGAAVTTNYVLIEAISLIRRRLGVEKAKIFSRVTRDSKGVRVFWVDSDLHQAAVDMMFAHPDQQWSIVDCSCFVTMTQLGIRQALTLDGDFEQAGFVRVP